MTERHGGLPDDPDLAAAFSAGRNRQRKRQEADAQKPVEPPQAAPEAPERRPEPAAPEVAQEEPVQAPVALVPPQAAPPAAAPTRTPVEIVIPDLGPTGKLTLQCAVNISVDVRNRFSAYQADRYASTGLEPTNAVVVRRAVLAANKANAFHDLREVALARLQIGESEDEDPDDLFGEVEGRRETRGRIKLTAQQPFRPSRQELAVIDAIWKGFGFPSRSDFLHAVLDWWLPPLPKKRRRA